MPKARPPKDRVYTNSTRRANFLIGVPDRTRTCIIPGLQPGPSPFGSQAHIYNWWSPRVSNPAKDPNLGQRVYKTPLNTCSDDLIKGWWSWRDSNPRLLPCKGSTLPLSYSPTLFTWSGLRDSNSYQKLGRLLCCR